MTKLENNTIFGIKINSVDMPTTLDTIEGFIRDGSPHMVVTADSSGVVMAQDDLELKKIINEADMVTPDSAGILWAARKFGRPLPERVSGADIAVFLCERAAKSGHSVFLLGSEPGVADTAEENLTKRFPGLKIAGTHHGYFGPEESDAVVAKVRDAQPDILFVAFGIPRQEKWIYDNKAALNVPVSMGVGGTLDVIAGKVKRAPKWMQRNGLEWIYRLASNPKKISKCMTLPIFVMMVLRSRDGK